MNERIAGVIGDARNLRDYALLSGSVSADELIRSLTPFEIDPDLKDEEKLKQLQIDVVNVARSIDPETRHRVLSGEFRKVTTRRGAEGQTSRVSDYCGLHMTRWDYVSAVSLFVLGFLSLWLLASYSMLAVRSSQWLAEVEQRGNLDYVSEMRNLFDAVVAPDERLAEARPGGVLPEGVLPPSEFATYNFMSSASRLKAMITHDENLLWEARKIELKYYWCDFGGGAWPEVTRLTNALFSAECTIPSRPSATREVARDLAEAALSNTTTPTEATALLATFNEAVREAVRNVNAVRNEVVEAAAESRKSAVFAAEQVAIARNSLEATNRILYGMGADPGGISVREAIIADVVKAFTLETTNQWLTGMSALDGKQDPRNYNTLLETAETRLQRYLEIINGWILPVLFGALGTIVLCLTRTASKFYATPSIAGILARLALAMLGGALISVIFAPTYFSGATTASSSFVFLLCFVFGYSTSAFVTLLDNIANKLAGTKV